MPLSTFQPDNYSAQLQAKQKRLASLLQPFDAPELTLFASPPTGFRMRTEFRFWHDHDDGNYVMFPKGKAGNPVVITDFPIAHPSINALMQALRREILSSSQLRQKLYQVEFLATLSGDSLITLIYHKQLDHEWQQAALKLQSALSSSIVGRSHKQKLVLGKDHVDEILHVGDRDYHFRQTEGCFTQPNAYINQCMLGWTRQVTADGHGDLLELYCGNGNFTVALADQFTHILATEINKTSVRTAHDNLARNQVDNVKICRMASEEISAALQGIRKFRRLEEQNISLNDYHFTTVLVDPPRAGLDAATLRLLQGFEQILYISCNPYTLVDNLQVLAQTHTIREAALFDQFPYTDHIETGLLLIRQNT